jgi:hypothetical protein
MDWMRTLKPDAIISDPFKVQTEVCFKFFLFNEPLVDQIDGNGLSARFSVD